MRGSALNDFDWSYKPVRPHTRDLIPNVSISPPLLPPFSLPPLAPTSPPIVLLLALNLLTPLPLLPVASSHNYCRATFNSSLWRVYLLAWICHSSTPPSVFSHHPPPTIFDPAAMSFVLCHPPNDQPPIPLWVSNSWCNISCCLATTIALRGQP